PGRASGGVGSDNDSRAARCARFAELVTRRKDEGERGRRGDSEIRVAPSLFSLWRVTLARLTVVLLPVDVPARAVQLTIQPTALAVADATVGPRKTLVDSDSRLLCLESLRLATSQLAVPDAFSNAVLLMTFAPVDPSCSCKRCRCRGQRKRRQ